MEDFETDVVGGPVVTGLPYKILPKALADRPKHKIYFGDNLPYLQKLPDKSVTLVIIDPPFNTGERVIMNRTKDYRNQRISAQSFADNRADKYLQWIWDRMVEAYRILKDNGTAYIHLDYREVHYVKVMLDTLFGRENFLNEVIWAYDYGARTKLRWPTKHDTILVYVKNHEDFIFNYEDIDRIPYMTPGLQTADRAAAGKTPTDTWWHTIVPTMGKERTGYPSQKPLGIVQRMVRASSNRGDYVLDFFAGSGTTGEAALQHGRNFILMDDNREALDVMLKRFGTRNDIEWVNYELPEYR